MKHYRIYKLDKAGGGIVEGKDLLAPNDQQAMREACEDPTCPIFEVWLGTRQVGSVD